MVLLLDFLLTLNEDIERILVQLLTQRRGE